MKTMRALCASMAVVGALLGATAVPAHATGGIHSGLPIQATLVTVAYEPGSASAIRPSVNPLTDKVTYKCVFAGWRAGVTVRWQCNLRNTAGVKIDGHSGTFSGRTYETIVFSKTYQVGKAYCTEAYATSVDGGDSDLKCR